MDGRTLLHFSMRLWPGFPRAWHHGDFHALLVSLLFGWVLALTWAATFVWPEWTSNLVSTPWMASTCLATVWAVLIVTALMAAIQSTVGPMATRGLASAERLKNLVLAQEFYLQANYFEAEKMLRRNLQKGSNDVESMLLWISTLRRTRRIPQALDLISDVERLDAALPWLAELQVEKELCLRLKVQTPPAHD